MTARFLLRRQPPGHGNGGGLATWPMGKSSTWLMTPSAAWRILESHEELGNQDKDGEDTQLPRSGVYTPHKHGFSAGAIDLRQGGNLL